VSGPTAREVSGGIPREVFEAAVEAAAKAVCGHRSYRMIAAEVLAASGLADLLREVADCGVSFEDERIKWVEVQIDRPTWEKVNAYASPSGA
jgi:hypothetical protein